MVAKSRMVKHRNGIDRV